MAKSMTTSGMTNGQIDRACELLRAKLTKHREELESYGVQKAFGDPSLPKEWLVSLRTRVEAISGLMVVRHVQVNRTSSHQQVLDATGRKQYTERKSVDCMPTDGRDEDDVYFFTRSILSNDGLAKEYELLGLKPDPVAQAKVNEDDPSFADKYPNATQWQDANGDWHCAMFNRCLDELRVGVGLNNFGWFGYWWFAGVRK